MGKLAFVFLAATCACTPATSLGVLFDFENAQVGTSVPLSLTVGGITADFSALGVGGGYYIQQPQNTILYTPVGFSGNCLVPTSVYGADLHVGFSQTLNSFSILYAPQELACDSSATLRVNAYMNGALVGTNTAVADPPGTWPSATLSYSSAQGFNSVVVHYNSPPPTGGDYGSIFVADNMDVFGPSIWSKAQNGDWSLGPWTVGVPNADGAVAIIGAATSTPLTVTLDGPQTVGTLQLGNSGSPAAGYILSGGGSNSFALNNSGSGAAITLTGGSHGINVPVIFSDNVVVSGSGALAFGNSSNIVETGGRRSLTLAGAGATLILSGTNTYTGGTIVTSGTLDATSRSALPDATSLTVSASGSLIFHSAAVEALVVPAAVTAVPEPSSCFLLAVGAIGLIGFAWRRRVKPARP
jgi:autotransporter-associated beta strand protein